MTRIPLPLLTLAHAPKVCRVRVAELVVHLPGIAFIKVPARETFPARQIGFFIRAEYIVLNLFPRHKLM